MMQKKIGMSFKRFCAFIHFPFWVNFNMLQYLQYTRQYINSSELLYYIAQSRFSKTQGRVIFLAVGFD